MPVRESDLLFYITNNNNSSYSLFNRVTDNLILSEVTKEEVDTFLSNNNPSHSFLVPPIDPREWPAPVAMTGDYSYDTTYDYPWDTLTTHAPSYKQLKLDFGEDKNLMKRVHDLASRLTDDGVLDTYMTELDCDSDKD